ncbi:hypothetical protein SAMN04488009_2922 [Maribacter sedimenticola]|uniref:Uncharacterized protein n=2 Tax=Maribacter sedimenticola TaxID=228956 RepID=A0ABY1SJL9_9FLAO|nr:hypothetical protein SAMN04488009_2922 [Maribacter sedimenticola]
MLLWSIISYVNGAKDESRLSEEELKIKFEKKEVDLLLKEEAMMEREMLLKEAKMIKDKILFELEDATKTQSKDERHKYQEKMKQEIREHYFDLTHKVINTIEETFKDDISKDEKKNFYKKAEKLLKKIEGYSEELF